jgi:catecholate siderophore receptor
MTLPKPLTPTLLARGIAAAVGTLSLAAAAAPAPEFNADDARKLDGMTVEATPVKKAQSPKYTQPLLDTPQTVTQIDREVIEGQNLLNLRDVLATLPGITFGAGEGGGGYGDSINLRGFSANNDITVDGIRDSAQYSRTDTFNLETVEVINGANSVQSGAGAVGGTINLVSKIASEDEFHRLQAGLGTDAYRRATVDSNSRFGESSAFRINAMAHHNDVPGRDVEEFDRWGIAPSIAFGLGTETTFSLSYLHQEDDNVPQYGVPYFNGAPLPGVNPEHYFGYRNLDTQEIDIDQLTARLEHRFADAWTLLNQTRAAQIDQFIVVDPPQGSFCLAGGVNPATGGDCTYTVTGFPSFTLQPGEYRPSGPRGNLRDTTNDILINQTDLTGSFVTGSVQHDLAAGLSLMREDFDLFTGNVLRNANGSAFLLPITQISDPDNVYTGTVNYTPSSRQHGEVENIALYALDTMKFGEHWQVNLGARAERNDTWHRTDTIATPAAGGAVTLGPDAVNDDDLFSYRAGVVYKPGEAISYYLSHGNSKTPSKASVNGGCTVGSTTGTNSCNVDPETAAVTEIGGKWDLYDGRLSLTAALFRNDRSNYRVADPGNPDNPSGEMQLDGEARVEGVILGASGRILDNWMVYANYAWLDSEVLQGVSDRQSGLGLDYTKGDPLVNTPEHSLGLWTTYDLSRQWQLGYGLNYLGEVTLTQHSSTNPNGPLVEAPGYVTHRAMVAWRATRDLTLQLNATNLTHKEYYTRPRNNGWATPGDARSFVLTANYEF